MMLPYRVWYYVDQGAKIYWEKYRVEKYRAKKRSHT